MVFVSHNVIYYIAGRTKSTLFCWFVGLALVVSFVSVDRLVQLQVGLQCTCNKYMYNSIKYNAVYNTKQYNEIEWKQ